MRIKIKLFFNIFHFIHILLQKSHKCHSHMVLGFEPLGPNHQVKAGKTQGLCETLWLVQKRTNASLKEVKTEDMSD